MTSALWAITSFFNPERYGRRRENFLRFRERLRAPLIAVEASFGGEFELKAGDAEILLQLAEGNVMWQKERLLNIAIKRLPAECRFVAVLDADVAFDNPDWTGEAIEALSRHQAVQPFETAHFLGPHATFSKPSNVVATQRSVASDLAKGMSAHQCLGPQTGDGRGGTTPGLTWVYRREALDGPGLFEGCIIGGGDTAIVCGSLGAFEAVEQRHQMNEAQRAFYRAWAEPWHQRLQGSIGFIPGHLFTLWHGDLVNRQGGTRHAVLPLHGFDPSLDLARNPDQPWRWNSDKPRLHRALRDYFASRREDG